MFIFFLLLFLFFFFFLGLPPQNADAAQAVNPKAQRKLADKRATLASLKDQLAALNFDIEEREREVIAQELAQAQEATLKEQFNAVWIAKLQAEGRLQEATAEVQLNSI